MVVIRGLGGGGKIGQMLLKGKNLQQVVSKSPRTLMHGIVNIDNYIIL